MENEWEMLIRRARAVLNPRSISPFVEAGGVAAAILTKSGAVYTGVCIDTACSLGTVSYTHLTLPTTSRV